MLNMLLSATALTVSAALAIPSLVFAAECLAAVAPRFRQAARRPERRSSVAVLVPAHNEENGLSKTLQSIKIGMRKGDRLVVVADNCTDRTAEIAGLFGAEVVVRHDDRLRGKGFALHAGMRHLAQDPPEAVVIVDADCMLAPGALDRLAERVAATQRPVQACYLMTAPAGSGLDMAVREFAFLVKNRIRPVGMARLGLPCQLTGSGMAFPWSILSAADLSNDNLVEDMKLGLDLARQGHAPRYCEEALVSSEFPLSRLGSMTQNRRWQSGHLAMIKTALRSLTERGNLGNPRLVAMALDIMVPPLVLLLFLLSAAFVFSALVYLAGAGASAFMLSTFNLALIAVAVTAAWLVHGRGILPVGKLYRIPLYALRKVAFYARIFRGDDGSGWVRTDRSRGD